MVWETIKQTFFSRLRQNLCQQLQREAPIKKETVEQSYIVPFSLSNTYFSSLKQVDRIHKFYFQLGALCGCLVSAIALVASAFGEKLSLFKQDLFSYCTPQGNRKSISEPDQTKRKQ